MLEGTITLAHGGGGRLAQQLVREVFLPHFGNAELARLNDAAEVLVQSNRLAVSTDSFVVTPHRFPGGDIGSLAVYGTVNDLAMMGARPLCLTAGFIVEEGFELDALAQVAGSMAEAARRAQVPIVAGDTKVVEHGSGDGVFINTTGIGEVVLEPAPAGERAQPGDALVLSGRVGDHGMAVLMARNEFDLRADIVSDCAPLWELVEALAQAQVEVHTLRDPTRGGLATVLNEIAGAAQVGMIVEEATVPVSEAVRGACDMLGLDPLYVANEGKLVACVPAQEAQRALRVLRQHELGREAAIIGRVTASGPPGRVILDTAVGGRRVLDLTSGEQLPRIC